MTTAITSGRAHLAVTTWEPVGPPTGVTIVALHPGVGDRRIWLWSAPVWAEAGHRVVAYDRRGFGTTIAPAEDHDDLVDLMTVLDATVTGPVVLVGNSRGGGLALDLAVAQPDRVAGLVLIGASPSGYPPERWTESAAEQEQDGLIAAAEAAGDLDLVNRLEVRYWLDGTEAPDGRVGGSARELMLDMNGRALRAAPIGDRAERAPVWPELGRILAPTLVVVGELDLPGCRQQAAELAERLPHARLATVAESAHCPSLDQPAALAALVLEYLAALAT